MGDTDEEENDNDDGEDEDEEKAGGKREGKTGREYVRVANLGVAVRRQALGDKFIVQKCRMCRGNNHSHCNAVVHKSNPALDIGCDRASNGVWSARSGL